MNDIKLPEGKQGLSNVLFPGPTLRPRSRQGGPVGRAPEPREIGLGHQLLMRCFLAETRLERHPGCRVFLHRKCQETARKEAKTGPRH